MPCKNCKTLPVITLTNTNIQLCRSCFLRYFERKAFRTIRKYKLIEPHDHIITACSGGKDSLSLLHILNKVASKKMNIKLTALGIDEGIKNYRKFTLANAQTFCKKNNIPFLIVSFKKEFGKSLDEIKKQFPDKIACSMCGILRRYILNKHARKLKATKLATGHNLDDEAQSILMNQLRHNVALSARLGPFTGVKKDPRFIPRIKPFYFLTEKETELYAKLQSFIPKTKKKPSCPYRQHSNRFTIMSLLNTLEKKYPGSKHSLVASFMEILPLLKQKFKGQEINSCQVCKEPTSSEICTACQLLKKLK